MTREQVESMLERLRVAYGARDLEDLAVRLGMDETTFRVWLSRKKVPSRVLADASAKTGRSVGWLRDGHAETAANQAHAREPGRFFQPEEKQVNLTPQERALLENFRAAGPAGRLALEAASAALAKQGIKERKKA